MSATLHPAPQALPEQSPYEVLELEHATQYLRGLFNQFPFADWNIETGQSRSLAIAVAAMLTQFSPGLLPHGASRLGFFFNANAQRSGKTLMAKLTIIPAHGLAKIKAFPKRSEELEKLIDAAVIAGGSYLFLDNIKRHLNDDILEALMTTPYWTGRVLGTGTMFTAPNELTLFITANNTTCSADMAARFLIVDLFVEEANVQHRKVTNPIHDGTIMALPFRKAVLDCLHALIYHWVKAGCPHTPGLVRNGFEAWCATYASIVHFAGLGDCLEAPMTDEVGDTESSDLQKMVRLMWAQMAGEEQRRAEFTFQEIVDLCYQQELLGWHLKEGREELENDAGETSKRYVLKPASRSKFGLFLGGWFPNQDVDPSKRSRKRLFTVDVEDNIAVRAFCTGRDRGRRYVIELVE